MAERKLDRSERALALVLLGFLVACGGSNPDAATAGTDTRAGSNTEATCDATSPTASAEAHAVITKRCVTCHSATGMAGPDYDWTNELSLAAHRRNVAAQVAQGSMPPTGYPSLTPEEKRSLVCWARGI
jgi:uncharacterized membrane protein